MSRHAQLRWQQRCHDLDVDAEWYLARRIGKSVRGKIRDRCSAHRRLMEGRGYRGYWYAISRNRVIFVVGGTPGTIVTVWRHGVEDQP